MRTIMVTGVAFVLLVACSGDDRPSNQEWAVEICDVLDGFAIQMEVAGGDAEARLLLKAVVADLREITPAADAVGMQPALESELEAMHAKFIELSDSDKPDDEALAELATYLDAATVRLSQLPAALSADAEAAYLAECNSF